MQMTNAIQKASYGVATEQATDTVLPQVLDRTYYPGKDPVRVHSVHVSTTRASNPEA